MTNCYGTGCLPLLHFSWALKHLHFKLVHFFWKAAQFLLGGELLAERCRTDDLMPSIPVLCLPPSRVDPKVLGAERPHLSLSPGGSWSTTRFPPIRGWSQRGGDDTAVVLLWSWSSRTVTSEKSLSARCCTFQGFTNWNMFIPVNVTVVRQLLRAKSEVSSSVLIRQDAVSCGNDVEVVFVLVDDDS